MTTEWIVLQTGQGPSFWTSVSDATVKIVGDAGLPRA